MQPLRGFDLTTQELERRKAYLGIAPVDEQRLRDANAHLRREARGVIDRFYEHLLGHEHTRRMLAEPGLVDRLKALQARYFEELTSGVYDLPYAEKRVRVGLVHHRIGLSPEWYLGAYVKYLHIASDVLSLSYGRDYERYFQTVQSLTKIIYLDMGLAIDAYQLAAQEALKQRSDDLEKANAEIRKAQAAKQVLSDMIVHDLQNPVAGVVAALQTLRARAGGLLEPEREALDEALRRCSDLTSMIFNVLEVSRAEAGLLEALPEDVDLSALAREGVEAFRRAAELEGRTLRFEGPESLAHRSDPALLRRVLQNLIRNAIRHTPRGTSVVVRIAEGPSLSVEDDGPGIPTEVQPKIFEPFGSAALRQAGRRVDTGLGLPSCAAIARALGARLRVESDGRRGTTFTLSF